MTTYQDNTATVENEPIAQQMPVRVIDVDFSMGDSNSASEDMPKLGTKEFEELSRSLDTRPTGYRFVKRAFDMVMSVCVLAVGIILWPIVLVMLIVIAVQTKGFPIYVQERVGQYGRTIRVPKIRTMVADSENVEKYLNEEQLEEWRKERKVTKDPRVDSRIIETNAKRPLSALAFASAFPPKMTVVLTVFPQVNAQIIHPVEMVGVFFVRTGHVIARFSQKLAKQILAFSEGSNSHVRIPSGAAGLMQPASA